MITTAIEPNHLPTLDLSAVKFTHAQFAELCETNRGLQLELSSTLNSYSI